MYKPPARRKITKAERKIVYEKCGRHCAYCGKQINISEMQVDHLIPMELYEAYAANGVDLDTMENYMPACRSCNHYKSSMTLEKFRAAIERWPEVLMRDIVTYRNAVRFGQVHPNPHPVVFYFERRDHEEDEEDQSCSECEYFNIKYCECEHPDQRQGEVIKNPTDGADCELFSKEDWS